MATQKSITNTERNKRNLHVIKVLIRICILLNILFCVGALAVGTIFALNSYDISLTFCSVGVEVSLACLIIFYFFKNSIYIPPKKYENGLVHPTPQIDLLYENLKKDIEYYQAASHNYFLNVRYYKVVTIGLSGLSTVLLGLHFENINGWFKDEYPTFSKNVALIIGTIITLYTTIMSFFNIEKYWLINKTIANKLISLTDEVENADRANKLNEPGKIDEIIASYKKIKEDFNKYWEGALSDRGNLQR